MDSTELAQELGVKPKTIIRLTKAGKFPFAIDIGLGSHANYRYSIPGFNAWLNEKKNKKEGGGI